jgi:hypothetical protein
MCSGNVGVFLLCLDVCTIASAGLPSSRTFSGQPASSSSQLGPDNICDKAFISTFQAAALRCSNVVAVFLTADSSCRIKGCSGD